MCRVIPICTSEPFLFFLFLCVRGNLAAQQHLYVPRHDAGASNCEDTAERSNYFAARTLGSLLFSILAVRQWRLRREDRVLISAQYFGNNFFRREFYHNHHHHHYYYYYWYYYSLENFFPFSKNPLKFGSMSE